MALGADDLTTENGVWIQTNWIQYVYQSVFESQSKLEQLERLRSEDTPRRLMITHTIESCWIPQVKTRLNDLENIQVKVKGHDMQHTSSC